ncbi:MAG: YihY/virulence factor BrkB family protein [Candidatus Omnitrophica bacterium]|nr:YihY/virulence factor BrkB family protein [Candidatus Omnitrophota bacterium]
MIKKSKSVLNQCVQFLQTDIWRIRASNLTGVKSFWIRQLRIFLLSLRGFNEDKCLLRASALTFYSLLSVVPVVAMAFGVAKGFGFETALESQLIKRFPGQEEVVGQIIGFANTLLENTRGGVIAGIGVCILFWTVIKVLGNIETSFNDIWGIKKSRTVVRKFSDYLSIMLICPILLIMSSSITVFVTSQLTLILSKLAFLGPISSVLLFLLKFIPYCVLWVLFTFIYIFMPNTKVKFKSGMFAGIIAGSIYQVWQWIYINFQIGAVKYGAIYGSFAALPLFLMWLQVSWKVVLFGAEISFAEQNVETYEFEHDCLKSSLGFQRVVALGVTNICVKNFCQEQDPPAAHDLALELEVPIRLVRKVLFELTEAKVLNEVKINDRDTIGFQPAHDIQDMTIREVLDRLEHMGIDSLPLSDSENIRSIKKHFKGARELIANSEHNVRIKDL